MKKKEKLSERFFRRLGEERRTRWGVQLRNHGNSGETTLYIQHPFGLVSLAGYLKKLVKNTYKNASSQWDTFY